MLDEVDHRVSGSPRTVPHRRSIRAHSGRLQRIDRRLLGYVDLLQSWLGDVSVAQFRADHLGRHPLARPNTAQSIVEACNWNVLDRALTRGPDDILVVARGKLLDLPPPRSMPQLRALFGLGIGIALREAERHSPEIAAIATGVANELPGDQRVIVFATPAGTHGFGWHYDAEDVFIVQTAGDKTYYFRRNTLEHRPARGVQPDFRTFDRETTPIMACTLQSGDCLYLPRGYWHVARAHTAALSLSIGVFPE
jgi:50S ribosomal protein L16 3-hydroxylase